MGSPQNQKAEGAIQSACEASDYDTATAETLSLYGGELLGWLIDRVRDPVEASEVFSLVAEELWKSLPTFKWKCSMRTWSYLLARRTANHYVESRTKSRRRKAKLSSAVANVVDQVRSSTQPHLKSSVKQRFRDLRRRLSIDDRSLLILRVDRELAWTDIAAIFLEDPNAEESELTRESARLRKQFQALKKRLKELAEEEGLLG